MPVLSPGKGASIVTAEYVEGVVVQGRVGGVQVLHELRVVPLRRARIFDQLLHALENRHRFFVGTPRDGVHKGRAPERILHLINIIIYSPYFNKFIVRKS